MTVRESPISHIAAEHLHGPSRWMRAKAWLVPWTHNDQRMFLVLVGAVVFWVMILGRLVLLRHNRFATFDFDSGIHDQLIWQLAHFRQFTTVRGVPFFGNHASFAFFFLAPLTWLGAGNNTWNLLNAAALGAAALVLYRIAQDKLGRPWLSLCVGLVWLLQPSVQWWVQEAFHPECVALPFLFATWLYGERIVDKCKAGVAIDRRLRWSFIGSAFATIIWKEDLALALVGMGLVWLVRRHVRLGLPVVAGAALWFAVFGAWMVPHFAGGTVYGGIYGDLGATPSEVVTTSVQHPSRLTRRLADNDAASYANNLQKSFGYVGMLSPVTWLIGAPQWGINVLSTADFTWNMHFHYQAIPLAAIAISFVEGLVFLRRRWRTMTYVALAAALASSLYLTRTAGPSPASTSFRSGIWPLEEPVSVPARARVVAMIPADAGVSADYQFVPHLTHRRIIYTFPNPWININYGIDPTDHGNQSAVDWVAYDVTLLDARNRKLADELVASGEFTKRLVVGNVELLERIAAPGEGTRPIVIPTS